MDEVMQDRAVGELSAAGEPRTLSVIQPEAGGCCGLGLKENISREEKQWSLWGGAALMAAGAARGRLQGMLLAGIGAGLVYRGTTGHCHMYEMLGVDTSESGPHRKVAAE